MRKLIEDSFVMIITIILAGMFAFAAGYKAGKSNKEKCEASAQTSIYENGKLICVYPNKGGYIQAPARRKT
jgi:uncharacterized protein YpmB